MRNAAVSCSLLEFKIFLSVRPGAAAAIGQGEATSVQNPPFWKRRADVQGRAGLRARVCAGALQDFRVMPSSRRARFAWRIRGKIALVLVRQSNGVEVPPLR
jgi:hypothetical protein